MSSAALVEVCKNRRQIGDVPVSGNRVRTLVVAAGGERLVDGGQQARRICAISAENNPVGMEKILYCCTFAKEFGI